MKINEQKGTACILAAGTMWGSMGLFVRGLAADNLTSIEIVTLRSCGALLIVLLGLLIVDRSQLRIRLKDIWCFIGTGVISLTSFNLCYFMTIQRTSMAVAAILLYTSPIFVVIFSAICFKEKITKRKIIAMIIAFIGCVLVTGIVGMPAAGTTSGLSPLGILIGIGAGVGYALYSIFSRYALERGYSSATISLYTFFFATLSMIFIVPVSSIYNKVVSGNTGKDILLTVGIAIVATVLPYLLYTLGLSGVENGKAGIIASVEPVVATILGMVVYHETLTPLSVAGILLVLVAVVMLNRKEA